MKKSFKLLYLALLLGIIIGACAPCDDGDFEDNTSELRSFQSDSTAVD